MHNTVALRMADLKMTLMFASPKRSNYKNKKNKKIEKLKYTQRDHRSRSEENLAKLI